MAEVETTAGGVTIKTGDKDLGQTMLENAPIAGNIVKAFDAHGKLDDGASQSEIQGLVSEGSGVIQAAGGAAVGIATDPLGWLVGQGLNFLISVCQPIQDAIHWVSGNGPALAQAADNFAEIGKGVQQLREKFEEDLKNSVQSWGGDAAETAGTKLAQFAKGIDGVAGQAGELSEMLHMSSMVMTVIEDFIKAILTELVTWLITIWVPALAAAVPTAGASTAAATGLTTARVATTGGKVARMVGKLRDLLSRIADFLRRLKGIRMADIRTGFKNAMPAARQATNRADSDLALGRTSLGNKFRGSDGEFGERVNDGFLRSMGGVLGDTTLAQFGAGTGTNAGVDKLYRNAGSYTKSEEADAIGSEASKSESEDYLDL